MRAPGWKGWMEGPDGRAGWKGWVEGAPGDKFHKRYGLVRTSFSVPTPKTLQSSFDCRSLRPRLRAKSRAPRLDCHWASDSCIVDSVFGPIPGSASNSSRSA